MAELRQDPEQLLQAIRRSHQYLDRGRLKVFFGATAGVGKTYAMLEAAQQQQRAGRHVVVGIVETHGRPETAELLAGLPYIPLRQMRHRNIELAEFDLETALEHRPELILIDELAHTNVSGSRHLKRWQDVEELLDAGIHVYTTVNVQHLESLKDVILQITGVTVRETIPDFVLDQADEIELIDIPASDLLQRLKEGKVYLPQQAQQALANFFTAPNLTALRELALRRTAQQVDAQLRAERTLSYTQAIWPATERIIVCISPSPHSADLVRAAHRLAAEMDAQWEAVFVETALSSELSAPDKERLAATMRLAESLGGEAVTLNGELIAETLVGYARQRNASKIVIGKPTHPVWRDWLRGSLVASLIRHSGDIDVYVVREQANARPPAAPTGLFHTTHSRWGDYLLSAGTIAVATAAAFLLHGRLQPANLIMVYLLAVIAVSLRAGRGPAILAAILAVAAFDFCFVPPHLTFAVYDVEYLITFGTMLLVSLIIANLTLRLKQQARTAIGRERRTSSLYRISRELAQAPTVDEIVRIGELRVAELSRCQVHVVLAEELSGGSQPAAVSALPQASQISEAAVMRWVLENGKPAGRTTDTLPSAAALYLPLSAGRGTTGVLAVLPSDSTLSTLAQPEQRHLLETCCTLIAIALERELQGQAQQQAEVQAERERLRSALLSSISHDLRTPLAAISGSAETLITLGGAGQSSAAPELLQGIKAEADRLELLLENILDMTRLESGRITLRCEPQPLEEVVGAVLQQLDQRLRGRMIDVQLPADLPLVRIDAVLIERVLVNLFDNAFKYTPDGSPLLLAAKVAGPWVEVDLADRGPGLPAIDQTQLFHRFNHYGGPGSTSAKDSRGIGLGLSICQAIINSHGGIIYAAQRDGGGSVFSFTLPVAEVLLPYEPQAQPQPEPVGQQDKHDA